MWSGLQRELRYLIEHKWDLSMVTIVPLLVIVLFSAMFYEGKAEHLPIAIIDQDHSQLSENIDQYLSHNNALKISLRSTDLQHAEQQLNSNQIWGYVLIPAGAEQRLVQAKDAQIAVAFNQSYFSVGNSISSAMYVSTLKATADYLGEDYMSNLLLDLDIPTAHVKVSTLYNPSLNYEFYLLPFMIPAVLHLLLCCCVAFAIGQEFKYNTAAQWLQSPAAMASFGSKILVYILIFTLWTWLWMYWLIVIRGWFVAGHLWIILLAQFLLYSAYALMSACVILATKDLAKTFGVIAVYGGSSLSFAGVTLPLNNAAPFTQFWSALIPYTPYAKLQTQQWVIGSPLSSSLSQLWVIVLFCLIFTVLSLLLLKRYKKGAGL